MEMTDEFSELLGAFVGDGWTSQGNNSKMLVISGNPLDEKEYYERIKGLFKQVFGIEVRPRHFHYWKTYGVMVCKPKIIEEFHKMGMPLGHKSSIVTVPTSVLNDKKFHVPFLRGLFDTDGTIYFQKSYNSNASKWQKNHRHVPIIELCSVSPDLMKSVYKMFRDLGFNFRFVKKRISKRGRYTEHKIRITGKGNIRRFFKEVHPKNQRHVNKFNLWLKQGFY